MSLDALQSPAAGTSTARLTGAAAGGLGEHLARNGVLPLPAPDTLLRLLRDSGLTGRGGAAFPAWRKAAASSAAGPGALVVANGAEGEPASAKDRQLLLRAPHLVLDGVQVAAAATGATGAVAYVPAGAVAGVVRRALAERAAVGADRVPVEIVTAPDTLLAGQETAVVAAIEGRPAIPRDQPVRVIERGVRGRPTLVQNVETLAHAALVARYGAAWFREAGTPAQPGTFLATVSGGVRAPGVHEVPYGVRVDELLDRAGGAVDLPQAVLVGGYHGAWLPFPAAAAVPLSAEGLAPWGIGTGAGILVALPYRVCGVAETARIVAWLADQGAGQCGPCLNGLPAIAGVLDRLARREAGADLPGALAWLTRLVDGRGACAHPTGVARLVRSTLRTFDADVHEHARGGCLV
jgi:NADH:ubiquinone oxidoreductase subunit F (NADH-binding)